MENSILKIFGSVDVKINPENVIKRYGADVLRLPDGRSELIFVTYDLWKWSISKSTDLCYYFVTKFAFDVWYGLKSFL